MRESAIFTTCAFVPRPGLQRADFPGRHAFDDGNHGRLQTRRRLSRAPCASRQSLRHARSFLDQGYNALIFPEGTRSMTGIMADFKPVVGYLALHARVGILPMYLEGTYEAMPKGTTLIKNREVGARIGHFLSYEELEEMTRGMARAEHYRLIAA